jgi:exopolyphosphatase/guanosine-5'-triphosphate,3'-diphosphate pyrophosphatase
VSSPANRANGGGTVVAAIDCGTNSTRLLITDAEGNPLRRLARITRLGQGVDATGQLAPEAISRTLAVLNDYRAEMDRLGVGAVRMSTTSASRDARNRADFFGPAEKIVGTRPELLSGEEEGRLSFAGATAGLDPHGGPYVVVDIGGGSTEVVLGPPPRAVSMNVGCVRLTERYLRHDPPLDEELAAAADTVRESLQSVISQLPGIFDAPVLVGLAGTITTLAAIQLGLVAYEPDSTHHSVLTRRQVDELVARLAGVDRATRLGFAGLEAARADVIVGGAVVLATLMEQLHLETCLVSETDILDGMVMSLLDTQSGERP